METYKIRKLIEAGFTDEQIDNIQNILFSPEMPKINNNLPITEADVGLKVRMSDGTINVIDRYHSESEIDLEYKVDSRYYTFTSMGIHWEYLTKVRIVEVLRS